MDRATSVRRVTSPLRRGLRARTSVRCRPLDTVTGKTVDAQIIRVFEPDDPQKPADSFNQVVAQAAGDGWEWIWASSTGYTGEREIEDDTGQLQVGLSPCKGQTCLYLYLTLH